MFPLKPIGEALHHLPKRRDLIGEFIQINAFFKAVEEIKGNCCRKEKFRNGQNELQAIWKDFIVTLEHLIQQQDSTDKLSTFIRIVQNNLTDFADKIYALKLELQPCSDSCEFSIMSVLKEISKVLIDTLVSLRVNYADHFDHSASVPLLVIRNNSKNQHIQIIKSLEAKRVDPVLVDILSTYLISLHVPGDNKIKSWRQFFYMKKLVDELTFFILIPSSLEDNMRLIRLLIGFDFNPLAFYEYMVNFISNQTSSDFPYEEQELELIILLKTFENIRPEIKPGYNDQVPPIQESIRHFINNELETLSRMKEVMSFSTNSDKIKNSPYYFDVSATIEELFLLLKVMTEVRFIKTRFKANLYNFVSRHIRTSRTKTPSEQYMRNIFAPNREIPVRIIKQVRSWLMVMITFIDKNYSDKLKLWLIGSISYSFFFDLVGF